jgi:hypothetical protein
MKSLRGEPSSPLEIIEGKVPADDSHLAVAVLSYNVGQ